MKVIVLRAPVLVPVLVPGHDPVQGGQKPHVRRLDLRPGPDHAARPARPARHRDLDVHGHVVVDLAREAEVEVDHQLPIEAVVAAAEALLQIEAAVVVAAALLPITDHDIPLQGAEAVPDPHRNHKPVAPTPANLAAAAIRNKHFRFFCGHVSVLFKNPYLPTLWGQ